jgi:hypothetical protein
MTEMGIPGLGESLAILDQERPQTVDFMRTKAVRLRKADRLQPKLRDVVAVFNIDVRRFGSFEAIEEESEARDSQYSCHGCLNTYDFGPGTSTSPSQRILEGCSQRQCFTTAIAQVAVTLNSEAPSVAGVASHLRPRLFAL